MEQRRFGNTELAGAPVMVRPDQQILSEGDD